MTPEESQLYSLSPPPQTHYPFAAAKGAHISTIHTIQKDIPF